MVSRCLDKNAAGAAVVKFIIVLWYLAINSRRNNNNVNGAKDSTEDPLSGRYTIDKQCGPLIDLIDRMKLFRHRSNLVV